MPNLPRSAWIVFSTHVRRMFFSRRMLMMAALGLLPAGAGFLAALKAGQVLPRALAEISWFLLTMLIIPFVSLVAGSAVVAEEVADGTLTYVFSRPVSRAGFFLGRSLAAVVCVLAVTLPAALGMYVTALYLVPPAAPGIADSIAGMPALTLEVAALGACVYTLLFAALGTLTRRPMVLGIAYSMVFEGLFANLPGTTAQLSIQHHLRSRLVAQGLGQWDVPARLVSAQFDTGPEALSRLLITAAVALLLGMWFIRRRQFAGKS